MRRIQQRLTALVVACSLGGLTLSGALAWSWWRIDHDVKEASENSLVLKDLSRLTERTAQWLLITDLILDSGFGLLLEPAEQEAEELEELAFQLATTRLGSLEKNALARVGESIAIIHRTIETSTILTGPEREQQMDKLVSKVDRQAGVLIESLDKVWASLDSQASAATMAFSERRGMLEFWGLTLAVSYLALVALMWQWVAVTTTQPLLALAHAAREASVTGRPLRLREHGPQEVRELTRSVSTLVNNLESANLEMESKVRERTAELERANRAKSEFLANMSHEIRTPMSAILGYAEILRDPDQEPSDRDNSVEIIRRNGEHLLSVINDILYISKVEAGRMTVRRVLCSPADIVTEIGSLMKVRADGKNLSLSIEGEGRIPETILSDPMRLRQILVNLIGNAIKFTESGGVRLVLSLEESAGEEPKLHFETIDTGIGMTAEEQASIFEPFFQALPRDSPRRGGTGLGLAISRRLAGMLGGTLTVQSNRGAGSRFTLTVGTGSLAGVRMIELGLVELDKSRRDAVHGKRQGGLRGKILLAEDGRDTRNLLAMHLRKAGLEVSTAENGRIAVDKASAALGNGEPFDLILMDMQMPEMNGYEATESLRNSGYDKPIVALTAYAMSQEKAKCLSVGCDDFATKPIDRNTLIEIASRYARSRELVPDSL